MKKKAFAVIFYALLITTNSYAQSGGYAGVSGGQITLDIGAGVTDFKDTTFKLFVGHQINDLIAVEGYWTKMDDTQEGVNLETSIVGVSAVITPIKNNKISPFIKVGFNKLSIDSSTHDGLDESDSNASFGGGLQVKLANNLSIRGEYENFESDLSMVSVGVVYAFQP